MSPLVICIAAFIGVTALVGAVAMLLRGDSENKVEDRLSVLTGTKVASLSRDVQQSVLSQPLDDVPGLLDRLLSRFGRIGLLFEQADTSLTTSRFVIISAITGLAGGVFCITFGLPAVFAPVGGLLMSGLPMLWILWRRKRRLKAFARQLPDSLELIGRALRAGHSLAAGFDLVRHEMCDPIATEFGRVFEEQNLGIPMDEALESLTNRVPNLDLKFFSTAVILQRQTGGDLAEILDKIGRLIRERFRIWGQVQALTGEGRLSGVVLLALPPVLFLAVYRLNPEYVMMLFTDPMGKKMLFGAVVLQVLGAITIRHIINIKV